MANEKLTVSEMAEILPVFVQDLLGITGHYILPNKCAIHDGVYTIAVRPKTIDKRCVRCGSSNVKRHTHYKRDISHVPIGTKRTQLRIYVPRIFCKACKNTSTPTIPEILPHHNLSVALRDFMIDRYQSRQVFAQISFDTGVSETTTSRVIKERIAEIDQIRQQALSLSPQVGVDDIRFYRGGDGIWTHIVDLHTGETIDLLPGTSGALLQFFFGSLRDTSALTSYCSDGAIQYIQIGRHNFPYATRTLNRFHVVRYLLEGFDAVRTDVRIKSGGSEPIQISLLQDTNDALEENQ